MKKWKIYLVPHTHWDKEWYFTKQDSDILLFSNIKNIMNVFKENKKYNKFTYDGQVSIIDDYIEYNPKDLDSIKKLVSKKKLIVGPWYTQPDFFNTTSESIVRNLLVGINVSKEYGADYLKTAYVPDSFGHNSQMPQIYKGFNLNNFIYWRGARNSDIDSTGVLHNWEGIDGTKIRAYNFYLGYWSIGSCFPYLSLNNKDENFKELAKKFLNDSLPLLNKLKNKLPNSNNNILLPLGGDQAPIAMYTPQFFEEVNNQSEDEWILSDYDEFFNKMDDQELSLKTTTGELKSPAMARVHKTIGSQRYDIKKMLKETEYSLFNMLEPLATYWSTLGGEYPVNTISKALKLILTSQAHDSIGGCNSDETNSDIENRLNRAKNIIESETTKIIKQISKKMNVEDESILIFNPRPIKNKNHYYLKIFTTNATYKLFNDEGIEIKYSLIKQILHGGGMIVKASDSGESVSKAKGFFESQIRIEDFSMEALSFQKIKIKESTDEIIVKKKKVIENENLKLEINNGSINIIDKIENYILKNQFEIYANVDAGDSYDYSPLDEKNEIISKLIKSDHEINCYEGFDELILNNKYSVPKKMSSDETVEQDFKVVIKLNKDNSIDLKIFTKNVASEIRWRIKMSSDIKNNLSFANQAYSEISRSTNLKKDIDVWKKENWVEKPVAIETNESYVYLKSKRGKIGFVTKGCNEYEIINDDEIHLTLFKSVEVLGRNDLLWRPGRASGTAEFSIPAINAALIAKDLCFEITWFNAEMKFNINEFAETKNTDTIFYQTQNYNNLEKRFDRFLMVPELITINNLDSLFEINNSNFIVKTIKLAEDKNGIIVRGFNKTNKQITISVIKNNKKISFFKANLLEEQEDQTISTLKLNPMEIGTIYINKGELQNDK